MLKSIIIEVSGMSCSHCEASVQKACEAVSGVESAKASAKKGVVKIIFYNTLFSVYTTRSIYNKESTL